MARMKGKVKLKLPPGWSAQQVTGRMTKPCATCNEVPTKIRVIQTVASIPFPTTSTYCPTCALAAMRREVLAITDRIAEFDRYVAGQAVDAC